jgi:hypothetical protein
MFERVNVLIAFTVSLAVLAATEDFKLSGIALVLAFVGIWLYSSPGTTEKATMFFGFLTGLLPKRRAEKNKVLWKPLTAIMGRDVDTREIIAPLLDILGSFGVTCITRYGKTAFLHSFLYNLLKYHSPDQLQVAIVDPEGFDFSLFSRVPHLFRPIARKSQENAIRLMKAVYEEMERRGRLFDSLSGEYLCNDIQRYHAIIEKHHLDLPHLPAIVFLFDEIQEFVSKGTPEEEMLKKIAKRGQKRGVFFVPATQRPTADVWSGDLKSQLTSIAVGYMSSNFEYGAIAKVPKEWYERMDAIKGRFVVRIEGIWRLMQGFLIDDEELASFLKRISNETEPEWPEGADMTAIAEERRALSGSRAQKKASIIQWMNECGWTRKPTANDLMGDFDVTENTALRWINECWPEYTGE